LPDAASAGSLQGGVATIAKSFQKQLPDGQQRMPQPERPVDKYGFPLPLNFEAPPKARPAAAGAAAWIVRGLLVLAGLGLMLGMAFKGIGPAQIAEWYSQRAADRYQSDDLPGALADADRAIGWLPDAPELYQQRALYRQKSHDLAGSLEDYNRLIEINPNSASAYSGRSTVYQRLQRHREAIDDVTRAIQLRPKSDHQLLNHRAYTRAIANMELDEALDDIQRAIDLIQYEEPAYLDTRGYVYYLLDRHEEALADMDRAVQLASLQRKKMLQAAAAQRIGKRRRAWMERSFNENEAVMIYHRGLVHEKLGHTAEAEADLARGRELGYNPAEGVY
jgi:tetratricopeptide (TPR) repeat protein